MPMKDDPAICNVAVHSESVRRAPQVSIIQPDRASHTISLVPKPKSNAPRCLQSWYEEHNRTAFSTSVIQPD